MSVESTTVFNLDAEMLIDFAFRLAGGEEVLAYDLRAAKQALGLLQVDMEDNGLPMWRVKETEIALTAGQASFEFASDVDEVLEMNLIITAPDADVSSGRIPINRIGRSDFAAIPYPAQTGQPNQVFIQRKTQPNSNVGLVTGTVWPVPDEVNTYTLSAWTATFLHDVTSFQSDIDFPRRYLTACVWGLAFYLGASRPQIGDTKLQFLERKYNEKLVMVKKRDADNVRLSLRLNLSAYNRPMG